MIPKLLLPAWPDADFFQCYLFMNYFPEDISINSPSQGPNSIFVPQGLSMSGCSQSVKANIRDGDHHFLSLAVWAKYYKVSTTEHGKLSVLQQILFTLQRPHFQPFI